MSFPSRPSQPAAVGRLVLLAVLLASVALLASPRVVRAGGVVGTGTPASCTNAALGTKLAGGGTVTFNCGGAVTINVSEHTISADTTINGGGLITLSGHGANRLFAVSAGAHLTLQAITLVGGKVAGVNGGGALRANGGSITLESVIAFGNSAGGGGAIFSDGGTINVSGSTLFQNGVVTSYGGSIYAVNESTVNITNSTIASNFADPDFGGGGLAVVDSTVTVSGSTIAGNTARFGGGLYVHHSALTMTNSTITGNQVTGDGGGMNAFNADVALNQVTIANNRAANSGGGVLDQTGDSYRIANSILTGNTLDDGTSSECAGGFVSQGYNLINDPSGCTATGDTTGNLSGQDPKLLPLTRNGGSTTTYPLDIDSPALDAGNPANPAPSGQVACAVTDQRGIARPQHGRCDIGAYESRQAALGNGSNGSCTAAAYDAAVAGFDAIQTACGGSGFLAVGEKTIARTLILANNDPTSQHLSLDAGNAHRLFSISSGAHLIVRHLTLRRGGTTGQGGLIFNSGLLTFTDSRLDMGSAAQGGLLANKGTARIERSGIFSGHARDGGGIAQLSGTLTIIDTEILGNSAIQDSSVGMGGAIQVAGGTLSLTNSAVTSNDARAAGGGLAITAGTASLQNVTIALNRTVDGPGGGISVSGGTLNLNNATIAGNRADTTRTGGGIAISGGTVSAANTLIADNVHDDSNAAGDCASTASAPLVRQGYNLLETVGDCVRTGDPTGQINGRDPLLGDLGDHGGLTLTLLPAGGSFALNAGNPSASPPAGQVACATTDQRGVSRPREGRCDIGATEHDATPPTATLTLDAAPNAAGWFKTDVGAHWSAVDDPQGSGLSTCQYLGFDGSVRATCEFDNLATADGTYLITASATDIDGNTGEASLSVQLDTTKPTVTGPKIKFVAGKGLTATTVPVTVFGWVGDDPLVNGAASGLEHYALQQDTDGAGFQSVSLGSPLATSKQLQLEPGSSYQFRVRAVDLAGNIGGFTSGPTVTLDAHQEDDAGMTYSSGWTTTSQTSAFGGALRQATAAGSLVSFSFTGTSVAWVSALGSNRGQAEVRIDGGTLTTVDLYASTAKGKQVAFVANNLGTGSHTITVKVLGTKNEQSTGTRVDLDAILVVH